MNDLISACDVGSLIYREFVVEVLVRARPRLQQRLSYLQGLELYDVAGRSLPFPDRVIEHHKGIWMQNMGGADHRRAAHDQLQKALLAPVYPGSERDAPLEHIHTSLAANVVQMVKEGKITSEKGLEQVRDHVRQAASPTFFNPHTSHVIANLFFELAQQQLGNRTDAAYATAISEAFIAINQAVQVIGHTQKAATKYEKDIYMLSELERKILSAVPSSDQLAIVALDIFNKRGSQVGFQVAALRLLAEANESNKGKDFNAVNTYLRDVRDLVLNANKSIDPELDAVQADLLIQWKLSRMAGPIDWEELQRLLESALNTARYKDSVVKKFYRGVCLFHLDRFTDATATFASIRRRALSNMLPAETRCAYRGSEGMPRRVQGTLEHKNDQYYLSIQDLGISVLSQRPSAGGGGSSGSTMHAYIVFSMNGPLAVYTRPDY